jgi:hypothetical protein
MTNNEKLGWSSLVVSIVGVVIVLVIGTSSTQLSPLIIWGIQILAIILGIAGRNTKQGKIGIALAILFSIAIFLYLSPVRSTVTPQ